MKCITDIPVEELKGKRVLVRAGLDLSLEADGSVSDVYRVEQALPTLRYLQEAGARTIIISHIGRDPQQTNAPVAKALSAFIKVAYVADIFGRVAIDMVAAMQPGDVVLLENLRQHYDLEKAQDMDFAKSIAALGEIYVNDAFSNSHREHASMVTLPKLLPHYAGLLVRDEVNNLNEALKPPHPAFVMIGGSKFETKGPVVKSFLQTYDHVFVVGAIANDILKARGFAIGRSKVSDSVPDVAISTHANLVPLPDVTVEGLDGHASVKKVEAVGADDMIVDIGPDAVAAVAPFIEQANFILWNGPTGIYEKGYTTYTKQIALMIAHRVAEGATCVIGGGDTIAAIDAAGVDKTKLGFLSTGGGAMLEYILQGTLPAISVLG